MKNIRDLKLGIVIEVLTTNLDSFTDNVFVKLSDNPAEWRFHPAQEAANIENCINKLFWESACCAFAHSDDAITSEVSIDIQCAEFSGSFHRELVEKHSNHVSWTPELSKDIEQVSGEIRRELSEMLYNLAQMYYTGAAEEAGEHYAFCYRY